MNHPAIDMAIKYLKNRGVDFPSDLLLLVKDDIELSNKDKKKIWEEMKSLASKQLGYESIRSEMWAAVYDAVYNYLSSTEYRPTEAMPMKAAIAKAYIETSDIAYEDGGGSLPLDEDTLSLAKSYMDQQLAYVDGLFETLKQLRKDGDFDVISMAFQKANTWSDSLDGFYNTIKLAGAGNKMLTFAQVRHTKESCDDCLALRGQRHRASWWISYEYVPPKGAGLACSAGGHCGDALVDDDGNEFTI